MPLTGGSRQRRRPPRWLAAAAVMAVLTPVAAQAALWRPSPAPGPSGGAGVPGVASAQPASPVPVDNPRPTSCDPVPANQGGPGSESQTQTGTFPWPPAPPGVSPEDYAAYDRTASQQPPARPANWSNGGGDWKLTSARTTDPRVAHNPQELCGVEGNSVDGGWQVTTGRPDTVIAVTDSGIEWCDPGIVDKVYLNRSALPLPENAAGLTKPELARRGTHFADKDPYDLDGSGVLNVGQYAQDPRVTSQAFFCHSQGGAYQGISPEDLIRAFGRTSSPDYYGHQGPRGFTEAIAGWNFVDDNNDPFDDVHYDHGTGEAGDSTGAADALGQEVGACPNCMVLPIRVGDSFIAAGNDFARGVAFAVDSGVSVIQEALGTLDESTSAAQAIGYANNHGVPVIASAADEEAEHHNEPANLPGTIVVNSVTRAPTAGGQPLYSPPGYLFLNGCTNYGANVAVSVESASCSSEATGKAGGVTGLIESAARDLLQQGKLRPYPGLEDVAGAPVALSATEVRELLTMSADDVDFQTAAPPGPPDNYAVVAPVPTTRYPTQPGFDMFTGYGRLDASRILGWLAAGKIPPEASLAGPAGPLDWFRTFDPTSSTLSVPVTAAAVRTPGPLRWRLQYGIGSQPEPDAFYDLAGGTHGGSAPLRTRVTLGPAQLAAIAAGLDSGAAASGGTGPDGRPAPDAFSFTLRLVVEDGRGLVGMDRRVEFLRHDPTLLATGDGGAVGLRPGGSVDAPPTLAPIGPGSTNALVVATADGDIHAYVPSGAGGGVTLHDLPGWPVHTVALDSHREEPAFATGAVDVPRASVVGGVAVGALGGPGSGLEVVASDLSGRVYVWGPDGSLVWTATTDPRFSSPGARNADNRLLRGVVGAPALAHLENAEQLDVVVSSMDRHVYAWRPDGTPVPNWPVLVVDPAEVQSVDPTTQQVTFKPGSGVLQGTKILDTPAVGDITGKGGGLDDVLVGTNEEYAGQPNASIANPINWAVGRAPLLTPANSRVYAIGPHGGATDPGVSSPQPDAGAFLPGWPASIGDFEAGLLPDVGDGTSASPALADLAGDGRLETGIITTVGPGYVLNPDGTSYLGTGPDGRPKVLSTQPTGPLANSPEYPSLPALGMPVFAPLGSDAPGVSMIAPAASVGKALDAALPDEQQPNDNQLDAWSTTTGHFQAAFPQVMNDLQFIVQPIVADVGGDTAGPYVVEGSATYDIRAVNALGQEAAGFPKFTGGWMVNSPSFGSLGGLPDQVLAAGTREGDLFIWSTPTAACASSGPWPREHHDLWNTGNLSTTGAPAPPCATAAVGTTSPPAAPTLPVTGGAPLPAPALPPPPAPVLPSLPPAPEPSGTRGG